VASEALRAKEAEGGPFLAATKSRSPRQKNRMRLIFNFRNPRNAGPPSPLYQAHRTGGPRRDAKALFSSISAAAGRMKNIEFNSR
jgi:hypothetical protein